MTGLTSFLSLALAASLCLALPDQYGLPAVGGGGGFVGGGPGPSFVGGGPSFGGGGYAGDGPSSPAQYSYAYENVDGASGNQFGHGEERDGQTTQGEYRVLLPDGRTQVVKYFVTGNAGYVAEVTYEGTAIVQPNFGGGGGGGGGSGGGGSYTAPPVSYAAPPVSAGGYSRR